MDELTLELPLPDWAPFGAPSEAHWRAVQRRRNLVQMVRQIAALAKDEGFIETAMLLNETASRVRSRLISPVIPENHFEMAERKPSKSPAARTKKQAALNLP
ncbi:MAG: hypothetical protein NTW56_11690 [Alphaproteobacteria bacterium]|nr:hypothetical protein [Alphaproteobacteria bacterium]